MGVMAVGARRLAVGCLVVAAAMAVASSAPAAVSPRVVGGGVAAISENPWQVAIALDQGIEPDPFTAFFCGGVVIDQLHVVTAAHCLDLNGNGNVDNPAGRQVIAGAGDLGAGSPVPPGAQRVDIASWDWAPGYPIGDGPYDVGLITLATPLVMTPTVEPVALVPSAQLTPAGTPATVSGYGKTEAGNPSPRLRSAGLFVVDDADCQGFYPSDLDRPTMLCAFAPGRDSCNGDSGGPLTVDDGTLIGLVSWGPEPCADPGGAPGVYTELAEPNIAAFIRDFDPAPGARVRTTGQPRSADPHRHPEERGPAHLHRERVEQHRNAAGRLPLPHHGRRDAARLVHVGDLHADRRRGQSARGVRRARPRHVRGISRQVGSQRPR